MSWRLRDPDWSPRFGAPHVPGHPSQEMVYPDGRIGHFFDPRAPWRGVRYNDGSAELPVIVNDSGCVTVAGYPADPLDWSKGVSPEQVPWPHEIAAQGSPEEEVLKYKDSNNTSHTARVVNGTTLILEIQGQTVDVPIDGDTVDEGAAKARGVSTSIAHVAYALLSLAKLRRYTYGRRIAFEHDGRRLVGVYEEHVADAGVPRPHPGITLLKATAPEPAPSASDDWPHEIAAQGVGEVIAYEDSAHAARTATLDGDTLVLEVQGQTLRAPIDTRTTDQGGAIAQNISTPLAHVSYAILGFAKQRGLAYGTRIGLEHDGRKLVVLYQEHPRDSGKDYPHPGITLLEPSMPTATSAPASDAPTLSAWWGVASAVSTALCAFHGYRRNQSVGWAVVWGLIGAAAPIIAPAVAVAQGFGEPRKPLPGETPKATEPQKAFEPWNKEPWK